MGIFAKYPYTDFNNLNLDWILRRMREVETELQQYLDNAVIKFADPITWDITEQYTALTVVVDSDGTAYLSKQPVPAGVDVSNTNYWLPIFNYDDNINELRDQIAYNARESATTGEALTTGDLVFWRGIIYKVLVDMPAGSAFIDGTNITPYTVDEKINDVFDDITTIQGDITTIQGDILNIQSEITQLNSEPVNILLLGAKNDGSEDVSSIINTYTSQYALYAPAGEYRLDNPVTLQNSLIGAGSERLTPQTTIFISNFDTSADLITGSNNVNGKYEVKHFTVDARQHAHGNIINANAGINKITDIAILNIINTGVCCIPTISSSRCTYIDGLMVNGATGYYPTKGVVIGTLANDCMFTNLELMACQMGMSVYGNSHRISNCHIWCGNRNGSDNGSWFSGTRGIDLYGVMNLLSEIQIDTAYIGITLMGNASASINNMSVMTDNTCTPTRPSCPIEIRAGAKASIDNIEISFNSGLPYIRLFNDLNASISGFKVTNLILHNYPSSPFPDIMPLCKGELMDRIYHLKDNDVQYKEIAAFYRSSSTGNVKFEVLTNTGRDIVEMQMNGSTITACNLTTFGSMPNLYYAVENSELTIYCKTASQLTVILHDSVNQYVAPINTSVIQGYTRKVKSTGVTQITNIP